MAIQAAPVMALCLPPSVLDKLNSLIREARSAAQQLLDMEHVSPAAHGLAAIIEILGDMFHVEPTPPPLPASTSGSPSSQTQEMSPTHEPENDYQVREHGYRPRETPVAGGHQDRERLARLERQNKTLQFQLQRRALRPKAGKARYSRYRKGRR